MFWRPHPPVLTLVGAPLHLLEPEGDLFVPLENAFDFDFLVDLSRFVCRKKLPIRTWKIYLEHTQNWAQRMKLLMVLNQNCQGLQVYCPAEDCDRLHRLLARHRINLTIHAWTKNEASSRSAV